MRRPGSRLFLLLLLLVLVPGTRFRASLRADVVINEIFYNPPGSVEDGEFVELHNTGSGAADLSGWAFRQGIAFEFPPGTTLRPGGFVVAVADVEAFRAQHPGVLALGPYDGALGNAGEVLALEDAAGIVVDQVEYDDGEDWPAAADGDGASLELINPAAPHGLPGNWAAGLPPSPGAANRSARDALQPVAHGVRVTPEVVTSSAAVVVTARVFAETALREVKLRLLIAPAMGDVSMRDLPMRDDGVAPDTVANDGEHAARIEPQANGTFTKFKVVLVDGQGAEHAWPRGEDESDYYAWLVDETSSTATVPGVSVFLSPEKLKLLETYAQVRSAGDPLYSKFDTSFHGFVALAGKVHRKVAIRHRGGFFSRHAGKLKYSWRLSFPDWDRYQGRGLLVIQGNMHWDDPYLRGDNGLKDKLCFLTFDRAGVPASRTRFIRLIVNGEPFGYHVELEGIDKTYLERNGFTGRGDLFKHGRTFSAHLYPQAAGAYATAYEKQSNDTADFSSLREFCDGLAAAGGGVPGSVAISGRMWQRDGGSRPANPTFAATGLTGFVTARRSIGLLAHKCLAEFDNICVRAQGDAPAACDLLEENGESIADWQAVEGTWEADGVVRLTAPNAAAHHRLARFNILDLTRQPLTVSFDVRITTPRTGDNWAGVGVFLGNPGAFNPQGTACVALRYANPGQEGLHLANLGSAWVDQSGQRSWSVGEWYRIEYTVTAPQPGDANAQLGSFLDANVDLAAFERYSTAIALSTHWDSANQNYFIYQDEVSDNRWVKLPWDMDITWGYSRRKPPPAQGHNLHPFDGTRWNPEPNEFATNALREAFLGIPALRDGFKARLAEALTTYFTEAEIHPVVDRIVRTDGVESQRDIDKWNALDRNWSWQSFSFHASFDKVFVSKRRKYLAEFLGEPPLLSQPSIRPAPAEATGPLTFRVNALGNRYDGNYDSGRGNLARVLLHLVVGGHESTVVLAPVDTGATDFYEVTIPAPAAAAPGTPLWLFYRFSATDDAGKDGRFPDPKRHGYDYLALDLATLPPAPGDVVINEILYHPRYYDIEFVELKNNLQRAVDISGWRLSTARSGVAYTLPVGTILESTGFLVLSRDVRAVFEYYNIVNVADTNLPFSLGNGGDTITLEDSARKRIDEVAYDDEAPWPVEADEGGPSLERIDSRSANTTASAWAASARQGTPGRPNSVAAPDVPPQPSTDGRTVFHRGDGDGNGTLDLTDAVSTLAYLFLGGVAPTCAEAADANNDARIDIADPIAILGFLFLGGAAPAFPGPPETPCGQDPDPAGASGDLGCAQYAGCR